MRAIRTNATGRILLAIVVIVSANFSLRVPLLTVSALAQAVQQRLPRTIAKGELSSIESSTQVLARTETEWAALWRRHAGERERPAVDFTREMVVGVFMGSRPNAGFSTEIITSMEVKGVLVVRYRETVPAPGQITAQVITFPYHLVAIPKAMVSDVKFEKVP